MPKMKNLKTFEGFFDFLKKDKSENKNKTKSKGNFIKSFFSKRDDEFAEKVFNSLKNTLESKEDQKSQILGDVVKYGDYKRKVKFKSKEGNIYDISIQKSSSKNRTTSKLFLSSSETYVLVINNRHFIDRKTGNPTISQSISKKIWDILDKSHEKKWIDKDRMEKDFE
jgi:hypothetical protein